MVHTDVDGRTPTEEQGQRFRAKAGRYPLLRWQSDELQCAVGEVADELDLRTTAEFLDELAKDRVLLLDSGVRVQATTSFRDPDTGAIWRTLSELRRAVVLNTGLLHFEADLQPPGTAALLWSRAPSGDADRIGTEYELTEPGRIWAFDPAELRAALDEHAEPGFEFFASFDAAEDGRIGRIMKRLRGARRRVQIRAPAIDPFRWRAFSGWDWVGVASKLEVLAHAADAYDLLPVERLALAREATWLSLRNGENLASLPDAHKKLFLVGPGVAIRRSHGGSSSILGPGSMTGFRALENVRRGVADSGWPSDISLRMVTAGGGEVGHVLVWDEDALRRLNGTSLWGGGWFGRFMQQRLDLYASARDIVTALAADPLFDGVDHEQLAALLPGASTLRWAVGGPPPVPVGMAPGLIVLLEGDVVGYRLLPAIEGGSVRDLRLAPTHGYHVREGMPRPVIGRLDTALTVLDDAVRRPVDGQLRARLPSRGVFLFARRFERVLGHDPTFVGNCRRAVAHRDQVEAHRAVLGALDERQGQFHDVLNVLFVGRAHSERVKPLQVGEDDPDLELIEALTEDIHARFGERSAIVELVRGRERAVDRPFHRCREHVALQVASSATDQDYHESLRALSEELVQQRDVVHVFLWSQREWPRTFAGAGDNVLLLSFDPQAPVPMHLEPDNSLLYGQLVPAAPGVVLPPGAVRLHTLRWEEPASGWISAHEARGRWARSVTQRRVGVALGGGGAWGWAHMALLRAMVNHEIPVDLISGASFGAIAGAVFSIAGKSGLTWAVENAGEIQRAVNSAMLAGRRAEAYFDDVPTKILGWAGRHWEDDVHSLGGSEEDLVEVARLFSAIGHPPPRKPSGAFDAADLSDSDSDDDEAARERQLSHWRLLVQNMQPVARGLTLEPESAALQLQRLPIPFFPVITELVAGSQSVVLDRSVGFGVRASGALPPLFPVTRDTGRTYADGGLSQNVPANVVDLEGAALIVASNIVPPSLLQQPLRTGRWEPLSDLNPIQRAVAALVGVQTLFNSAGQVETGLAPIVFQTSWNGKMFFNVDKGAEIVKDTYSVRSFWQAMDGLVDRWEQLRKPRRRDEPAEVKLAPPEE